MPRAIALVRVSSESQAGADRGGVPRQREVIRTIASREGLEIAEWVELEGVSGAAVLAAPRFQRLMAQLADPAIDGVIVAEFSRLMRPEDPSDYAILGAFKQHGKKLWTPSGARDLRRFADRLHSLIEGELSAEERRIITERTWGAKELMRRAGRHVNGTGSLPPGIAYRNERRDDGTVRPVWEYTWPMAGTVRALFARFVAGEHNLTALSAELGIDRSVARDALRNPIYRGVRRIDRKKLKGREIVRTPDEVIELRVIDEPLVSESVWEAAQALLASRPRTVAHDWPYTGMLRCACCGYALYSTAVRPYGDFYRCAKSSHHEKSLRGCPTGQIKRAGVEAACDAAIMGELASPERLMQLLSAALDAGECDLGMDAATAGKRIGSLDRERARVLLAYERGMRSVDDAERRVRAIEAEIAALREAALGARMATRSAQEMALALSGVFVAWESLCDVEKRSLLRPSVRALHVARSGPGRAVVPAVELWLPDLSPPVSPDLWRPLTTSRPWVLVRLAA